MECSSTSSSEEGRETPITRPGARAKKQGEGRKKVPIKRKLAKQFVESDSDENPDEPRPSTSRGVRRPRPRRPKAPPPSRSSSPPTRSRAQLSLTPSKFLPMLEMEEDLSELSEDPVWLENKDDESGSLGSPSGSDIRESEEEMVEEVEDDESEQAGVGAAAGQPRGPRPPSFVWSDGNDFVPDIHDFDGQHSGVTDAWPLENDAAEVGYFETFFDRDIMQLIVSETNRYYDFVMRSAVFTPKSRVHRWHDTNVEEMYVFFALMLLMPHCKKHVITDYWKNDALIPTPIFGKFMKRDRFLLLLRFLHFVDNNRRVKDDRLWKVRDVFAMIIEKFKTLFHPFRKLVIDESLVLFKGRLVFKQYIPSKRHRFGIKLFVLCDCETGIVLDAIVYTASLVDIPKNDPLGISGAVIQKMMARYLGKGHILYTDNWYTSPSLSQFLHDNKTGSCGTVKAVRKHMPQFVKGVRGSIQLKKSEKILAINWHDKREVRMITTLHKGNMIDTDKKDHRTQETIKKPDAVTDYTVNMRLIDKSDCQLAAVECVRKCVKWYHKLFFHMLDVAMLNAYNVFLVQTGKKPKLRNFSYTVIYQLLEKYGTVTSSARGRRIVAGPDRLMGKDYIRRHHLTYLPVTEKGRKLQKDCYVCKKSTKRAKKRACVVTICMECNVPLCLPCFMEYHTMKDY